MIGTISMTDRMYIMKRPGIKKVIFHLINPITCLFPSLGMVVLILLHVNLSVLTYCNDSYSAFLEIEKKQKNTGVGTIKKYLEVGTGYFLESYSDFILFLNKIEIGELGSLDYNELKMILDKAIRKMEDTKNIYYKLKQKAEHTPYNPKVINELLAFNYGKFQIKNHLLEPVYNNVKCYLCSGKIREMYGERISQIERILRIANMIKTKIEAKVLPEASVFHDLNEACSQSLLFGQYASGVFQDIIYNDYKE